VNYVVGFAPEALAQLTAIEDFIALSGTREGAERYVDGIVECCRNLTTFPLGGTRRDDLMPGLRITNYHSRSVIAYTVNTEARTISIVGVFYGGQDYEGRLAIPTTK
jgi:plasmid stabilization system protein ParE